MMIPIQCPICGKDMEYFKDCIRGWLSCPECGETVREFPATLPSQASAPVPSEPNELEFDVPAFFRVLAAGASAAACFALPLSIILERDYVKRCSWPPP